MRPPALVLIFAAALLSSCESDPDRAARLDAEKDSLAACARLVAGGLREVADTREQRFLGKVGEAAAECRGGRRALAYRDQPWLDWSNYWATGDSSSLVDIGGGLRHLSPNGRGIDGALIDLEYERIELIKFNLLDNYTYETYLRGRGGTEGPAIRVWPEMRLEPDDPDYEAVGGAGEQLCWDELIRFRTTTGICNDIRNPRMGSTNSVFARNVQFETAFPRMGRTELVRNRHGDRLGLLKPDPQVISRKLFTREQSRPELCLEGAGLPNESAEAQCDYKKAPFFNVLAAFWIQFMTHDWFSHLDEGQNDVVRAPMELGCRGQTNGAGVETPLSPEEIEQLGCRPDDRMEPALVAQSNEPETFVHEGEEHLARAPVTFRNHVTAWWDASQVYGYDTTSARRVQRDPVDPAKLRLVPVGDRAGEGEALGYLPRMQGCGAAGNACTNRAWEGQEAAAFPDNFTIGLSFYHNVFAREHNLFVERFRERAARMPDADSGLRSPTRPEEVILYADVTDEELFQVARLVIAAEIAKIHTIEWTTQLLYDEPLYRAMNGNWGGLFERSELLQDVLERIIARLSESTEARRSNQLYSVLAAGPGIIGLGSRRYERGVGNFFPRGLFENLSSGNFGEAFLGRGEDQWDLSNPDDVNRGVNHFGSPFNFPEEFITVYRLHPLVPDLLEYRDLNADPNRITGKVPVVSTFRGAATEAMRSKGLSNWALTMGRQRLGILALQNHAQFLQNLTMRRLDTPTQKIDVAALDIIRDRERGIPRFNEFRRQYGLRQLTSFDNFVDQHLPEGSPGRQDQERLAELLREVFGQHVCDESKIITDAQVNPDGSQINDCLGHDNGATVDNVEDVDTVVGWLAETTRPHGFAISETQFVVFILNASRRLFSDRFFTSSFRPEFYSSFGYEWVMNNGPDGVVMEAGAPNGHEQPVSPFKRVLLRVIPELSDELEHVVNVFDPWARDRGEYYSLDWVPRPGAESDDAFPPTSE
jgi:hypothetical protein